MLFLYLEELREYYVTALPILLKSETAKALKKQKPKSKRKSKKLIKNLEDMINHVELLVSYLDIDYDETKKVLYPLLKTGHITFDLLWALFKPNTIAFTSTYGNLDDPRCFKVDRVTKESNFMGQEWYSVEGRYLEYDGKTFGLGDFEISVTGFNGSKEITSLAAYPLHFHKDPEGIRKELIERGKRFVTTTGMNYRFHKGMAYQKKRKTIFKFNNSGRIMIDPAVFRRILPNYQISTVRSKNREVSFLGGDGSDEDCSCSEGGSDSQPRGRSGTLRHAVEEGDVPQVKFKLVYDSSKTPRLVEVPIDGKEEDQREERLASLPCTDGEVPGRVFTEEELLIASSVVLGFSFSDKLWLEFSLSGVQDIPWNEEAFASLVLPHNQKHVVKALVSSHKFHATNTIDDVIRGKGKGLVFVLHGPPGVGKTLTAEGVAEDLRCPIYAVSMGELGTDSSRLEAQLQQIMDIAHSWGAVLLLDEADVFLEKRSHQDVHRNALVSIFLRLLEYFQGILFLTTNRVGTFDEAFQSRIHVALKYDELTPRARKTVWRDFLEKVRVAEGLDAMPFKDDDYEQLSRKGLNGRQIKNTVRTAQALALHEQKRLSMEHIKNVLEVAEAFSRDLHGGTGGQSYFL
ncbi:P-loop containing nucleoside triphosphate hydrolase protein [Trichodelitschia bisporula]|uniref:P-loop containing nucleoside triphosphate hydrolase protein n=1 Tax=Trichodelitschia bisporula TaxID=703511 RepID=A0A6G1I141_9PEZI|nr:P-loop containing nucleoside triphosphate hydrolase protein [Trichodelitschia bisporula]